MERLYHSTPSFQNVGRKAYHPGLGTMLEFDSMLGHPHKKYKTIHIAGTNGKGSVAHILASILHSQGYKTGLYTSPHLLDFRERIKVDSLMISKEETVSFLEKYDSFIKERQPSFFEISTAMAFDHFAHSGVDIAVIETGLGGRLDSSNIITPLLSIITAIGFDHKDILGDTLEKIAREKGGIIKSGIPVVVGEVPSEIEALFDEMASSHGSPISFSKGQNLYKYGDILQSMDLKGDYQKHNLKTVFASLDYLKPFIHDESMVAEAICNAAASTGLRGRWETLSCNPLTICDIAHNPHALAPVMKQLSELFAKGNYTRLNIIFGVMADKEIDAIAPLLPDWAYYYFTNASSSRALPSKALSQILGRYNLKGESTLSVGDAISRCIASAGGSDLVYIGGSSYVVAEALDFYKNI